MNELVATAAADATVSQPMRQVAPVVVSPSEDLALVAQRFAHRMPRLVRYVMEGLGTPDAQSADLMSYLLFDRQFMADLVELGRSDAHAMLGHKRNPWRATHMPGTAHQHPFDVPSADVLEARLAG